MAKREEKTIKFPLKPLNVVEEAKVSIPLAKLQIAQKQSSLDKSKIGIRFEPHGFVVGIPQNERNFKIWLYWKNKPYPFNYIGSGAKASKTLGISKDEAKSLVLEKLKESLPLALENKDKELAQYIEWKIRELKPREPLPKRLCRTKGCQTIFQPKNIAHVYCKSCSEAYYGKKPQARDLLEDEKNLLSEIRKFQQNENQK